MVCRLLIARWSVDWIVDCCELVSTLRSKLHTRLRMFPAAGLYHYGGRPGRRKPRPPAPRPGWARHADRQRQPYHAPQPDGRSHGLADPGREQPSRKLWRRSPARVFGVESHRRERDLAAIRQQLDELIRPDGACPIHELELETIMPFSARPTAPYRMDLALTYRCNNDCAHCYNARERQFPGADARNSGSGSSTELWELGVPHIVFTGGEPTLRDDLPELIAPCRGERADHRPEHQRPPPVGHGLRRAAGGGRAGPCPDHGRIVQRARSTIRWCGRKVHTAQTIAGLKNALASRCT